MSAHCCAWEQNHKQHKAVVERVLGSTLPKNIDYDAVMRELGDDDLRQPGKQRLFSEFLQEFSKATWAANKKYGPLHLETLHALITHHVHKHGQSWYFDHLYVILEPVGWKSRGYAEMQGGIQGLIPRGSCVWLFCTKNFSDVFTGEQQARLAGHTLRRFTPKSMSLDHHLPSQVPRKSWPELYKEWRLFYWKLYQHYSP